MTSRCQYGVFQTSFWMTLLILFEIEFTTSCMLVYWRLYNNIRFTCFLRCFQLGSIRFISGNWAKQSIFGTLISQGTVLKFLLCLVAHYPALTENRYQLFQHRICAVNTPLPIENPRMSQKKLIPKTLLVYLWKQLEVSEYRLHNLHRSSCFDHLCHKNRLCIELCAICFTKRPLSN